VYTSVFDNENQYGVSYWYMGGLGDFWLAVNLNAAVGSLWTLAFVHESAHGAALTDVGAEAHNAAMDCLY
jgi:hypothetical protein